MLKSLMKAAAAAFGGRPDVLTASVPIELSAAVALGGRSYHLRLTDDTAMCKAVDLIMGRYVNDNVIVVLINTASPGLPELGGVMDPLPLTLGDDFGSFPGADSVDQPDAAPSLPVDLWIKIMASVHTNRCARGYNLNIEHAIDM